jgi:hypothetical protein
MYQRLGRLASQISCWDGQCYDQGQCCSPMQWLIPLNISFRPVKQGTLTPTSRGKIGCSYSHFPFRLFKQDTLTPTSLKNRVLGFPLPSKIGYPDSHFWRKTGCSNSHFRETMEKQGVLIPTSEGKQGALAPISIL